MHWDIAIMELWKGSEYAMFLQRQVLHKILNMPQNGWIMTEKTAVPIMTGIVGGG